MQAVILAAGKSTRTHPLTLTRPKVLLRAANKTIIEHNLDQLQGLVDEAIIIVGFKKEMIEELIGTEYKGMKISYVEQTEQLGTGHALLQAREAILDRFIVMNGDDLYSRKDIEACIKHRYCILAQNVEDPSRFGLCLIEGDAVKGIVEKPKPEEFGNEPLANTGLYVFDRKIFGIELGRTKREEFEIVDFVTELAKNERVDYEIVSGYWVPIGYPWSILEANERLLKDLKGEIKGQVEERATLRGEVFVGEGTIIKNGVYIEGPVMIGRNCTIGPNCFIRPFTSIGDGCKVGNAVEIKNCVLGDNVSIGHLSYFGDSIFGDNINIGAGTISANLRHDNQNVKSPVRGETIDTGRRKFGTVIGDGTHIGIKTSIYPGRKIWPGKATLPGEVVEKDLV